MKHKTEQREDGWYVSLDEPAYYPEEWHGPFATRNDSIRAIVAVFNPNEEI